jgi:hypothetical protein
MTKLFDEADVIHRYTRAQAIADGTLVDVSEWASPREMMGGFVIPVAMSAAVWALCPTLEASGESTRGRVHDALWMAAVAARRNRDCHRTAFTVRLGRTDIRRSLQIGPGDHSEPIATIMLEGED